MQKSAVEEEATKFGVDGWGVDGACTESIKYNKILYRKCYLAPAVDIFLVVFVTRVDEASIFFLNMIF